MGILFALFFLSGAAGLIYEVVWTRMLSDVVGSTSLSMTVVFSVFLAGLALGSWLFGRAAPRGPRGLRRYAMMELGIAGSALTVTYVMYAAGVQISSWIPGAAAFGPSLAMSMSVSAVLLALPTLLMGGTLPVLLSAIADWEVPQRQVTALYGWNTLGAALGALSAGLVLIWQLGMIGAALAGVTLNVGAGLVAWVLSRRETTMARARVSEAGSPATSVSLGGRVLWALALFSGLLILAYEVLWGRIAHFLLGDRTIAISLLLFVFIAALGLASLGARRLAMVARVMSSGRLLGLLGCLFLVAAAMHAFLVPAATATVAGGALAPWFSGLPVAARRLAIMTILVGPPILVLGLVFPLLAWGSESLNVQPGRVMGRLYVTNTVGAVGGAVLAAYVLSRGPGTITGFGILGASSCLVGGALLWSAAPASRGRWVAVVVSALVLGGMVVVPSGTLVTVRSDEALVAANEDEYGVQVLTRTRAGLMRVRNNRLSLIFDLGAFQTTQAQQMPAHLTMMFAEHTDDVINIGTGYGITAGTYTLYPGIDRISTIEILPFLLEHQPYFAPHNFRLLEDPRVSIRQGDGRHALLTSARDYDIISVNVLDPYLPGSSSLYTVDFWREARRRLRPGGVYTQLFWGDDVGILVKGLESVFPTVLYFEAYGGTSFNVVAFRDPAPRDLVPNLSRLSPEAREQIRLIEGGEAEDVMPQLIEEAWGARDAMQARADAATGPLHTDLRPVLEYRWANGAAGVSSLDSPLVEY